MIGRKALTGVLLLCAFVLSAVTAPSAFAETSGTTAVTCSAGATNDFGDAHCDNTKEKGGFGHKEIAEGVETNVVGTNAKTKNETKESEPAVLTTTAGGLNTEIVCATVSSSGKLENMKVSERHTITGRGIFVVYTGCTVPKPNGQGCKVKGGEIKTQALSSESVEEPSMVQKFVPTEGTTFVEITLEGCSTTGLNKGYKVEGSAAAGPSGSDFPASAGATLLFNIAKAGSTLTFGGQAAGLVQTETLSMEGGDPIASTAFPYKVG